MSNGRRRRRSQTSGSLDAPNSVLGFGVAYVLLPLLAAFMLISGSTSIGTAWSAAHGGGRLGSLHVTSRDCGFHRVGGYRCTGLYGTFTSTDGSIVLHGAFLDGIPDHARVGSNVAVRFLGERNPTVVYRAAGSREWLLIAGLMLGAAVVLAVWVYMIVRWLRDRFLFGHGPTLPARETGPGPESHNVRLI